MNKKSARIVPDEIDEQGTVIIRRCPDGFGQIVIRLVQASSDSSPIGLDHEP